MTTIEPELLQPPPRPLDPATTALPEGMVSGCFWLHGVGGGILFVLLFFWMSVQSQTIEAPLGWYQPVENVRVKGFVTKRLAPDALHREHRVQLNVRLNDEDVVCVIDVPESRWDTLRVGAEVDAYVSKLKPADQPRLATPDDVDSKQWLIHWDKLWQVCRNTTVITLLFVMAPWLLLPFVIKSMRQQAFLVREGIPVSARVLERSVDSDDDIILRCEYTIEDGGKTVPFSTTILKAKELANPVAVGDSITVLYDPRNPEKHLIYRESIYKALLG